jgi:YegS/Rv2252/BmrU family lipid kinase
LTKFAFIINPTAGKVKRNKVSRQIEFHSSQFGITSTLYFTTKRGHATELSNNISSSGKYDVLVAVGGDGTINEVINGFDLSSNTKFGVLPFGSGNDVARYLYGKKKNYFEILLDPEKHLIDLMDVGSCKIKEANETFIERKFINAVGIGFDAYVAYLNQYEKKLTGILSYLIAVARALKKINNLETNILIEGKEISGNYLLMTIGNGKTSGGGFYLNPGANPSDGIFDLTTVDSGSRFDIVKNLPYALINKLESVELAKFHKMKTIRIKISSPYYVHLDGEIGAKDATEIEISILEKKLKIIKSK